MPEAASARAAVCAEARIDCKTCSGVRVSTAGACEGGGTAGGGGAPSGSLVGGPFGGGPVGIGTLVSG